MKKIVRFVSLGFLLISPVVAYSQAYTENFDDVSTLGGNGWVIVNNSSPLGPNSWYQGIPTTATPDPGPFNAYNGANNAYIAANFGATTGGTGTISDWLITPNRTYRNGDVFTFYTRKPTIGVGQTDFPDRLEVRLSTNGASTNVGATAAAVGDFTTLFLSINPTLITGVYPQVWTQYTITISGLPAPTSGRIAFRYFVTNGGPSGSNSDYIGVDNVVYTPYLCPSFTMTPGGALTTGTAGSAYSVTLTQSGALGAPNYAITGGALPPGLTISSGGTISGTPTATGTFNFMVTVSDNSGCSGTQSYSITVICPSNPISFSTLPVLCDNGAIYTLVEGLPGGGTYSGTGVSFGDFDPSTGSQNITYDYTDPYGCSFSSTTLYTVNTAPSVTLSSFSPACDNAGLVTLSGGSPAGGVYSGTGVSGSDFDPLSGSQTITYTYTDANGCSNNSSQVLTVNQSPSVALAAFSDVCSNIGMVSLSGGSPAGGVYSGTGVSGSDFDPLSGSQSITYSYTDANGCSDTTSQLLTVHTAPVANLTATNTTMCISAAPQALNGTPAGGTYSGSSALTGNMFDPSVAGVGNYTLYYTATDTNQCSDTASVALQVLGCAGVDENAPVTMQVYPNPAEEFVYLTLQTTSGNSPVKVEIIGLDGKIYLTRLFTVVPGFTESLPVSQLAAGAYFIKVQNTSGNAVTQKFIKK